MGNLGILNFSDIQANVASAMSGTVSTATIENAGVSTLSSGGSYEMPVDFSLDATIYDENGNPLSTDLEISFALDNQGSSKTISVTSDVNGRLSASENDTAILTLSGGNVEGLASAMELEQAVTTGATLLWWSPPPPPPPPPTPDPYIASLSLSGDFHTIGNMKVCRHGDQMNVLVNFQNFDPNDDSVDLYVQKVGESQRLWANRITGNITEQAGEYVLDIPSNAQIGDYNFVCALNSGAKRAEPFWLIFDGQYGQAYLGLSGKNYYKRTTDPNNAWAWEEIKNASGEVIGTVKIHRGGEIIWTLGPRDESVFLEAIQIANGSEDMSSAAQLIRSSVRDIHGGRILQYNAVNDSKNVGYIIREHGDDTTNGQCMDFSAVTCGLLRSIGIPSRMSVAIPSKEWNFHCWDELFTGSTWLGIDGTYATGPSPRNSGFFSDYGSEGTRAVYTQASDGTRKDVVNDYGGAGLPMMLAVAQQEEPCGRIELSVENCIFGDPITLIISLTNLTHNTLSGDLTIGIAPIPDDSTSELTAVYEHRSTIEVLAHETEHINLTMDHGNYQQAGQYVAVGSWQQSKGQILFNVLPAIAILATFDKESALIDEEVTLQVTTQNNLSFGSEQADVTVSGLHASDLLDDQQYQVFLDPGEKDIRQFAMSFKEPGKYVLTAKAITSEGSTSIDHPVLSVLLPGSLFLKTPGAPREIDVNVQFAVNATVKNVGTTDVSNVSLSIDTPSEIQILDAEGTNVGTLIPSQRATANWNLRATEYGTFILKIFATDDAGGKSNERWVPVSTTEVFCPPNADAGEDIVTEQTSSAGSDVILDGSGSSDSDSDIITYYWFWEGGQATGVSSVALLPLGQTFVSLKVEDADGNTDIDEVLITVQDTTPPMVDAGEGVTVEQATLGGTEVTLTGSGADICDADLDFEWSEDGVVLGNSPTLTHTFNLGTHVLTLTAIDDSGNAGTDTVTITVVDTTPPDFTFSVSPTTLWPPNHKHILITPSWSVSDICDASVDVTLKSIVSNEENDTNTYDSAYDGTVGDGHTNDDIKVEDDGSIYLRAERSGTGTGRVYTITYEAIDDSGNVTESSAAVTVPHDMD